MASDLRLKEQLPELTDEIVETYTREDSINHLGHCPLPKLEVVISALHDLFEIIYPGYRRREGLHIGNVTYHVGDLIDGLHDKLTTQIARALMHEARTDRLTENPCDDQVDYDAQGQAVAIKFLQQLPRLRELLATDAEAAYKGDPACRGTVEVVLCYPGLVAITVYRLAHELYKMDVPFIPRMMSEWAHKETGIDIHPGATIGRHFFIDHGTGVVVGETCEIGEYVKLYQGVTLGALSFPTDGDGNIIRDTKRHPTIEDRVVVYASATILGGKNSDRPRLGNRVECLAYQQCRTAHDRRYREAETADAWRGQRRLAGGGQLSDLAGDPADPLFRVCLFARGLRRFLVMAKCSILVATLTRRR